MERKPYIDGFGAIALTLFALNFAFNQVVIKVTNGGFEPVFAAGLRSLGAIFVLLVWIKLRGIGFYIPRAVWPAGILLGLSFTIEFICIFSALDITTVSRASVIFYSMPVWLALAAHVFLPGERLTGRKIAGLVCAMAGVVLALSDRGGGQISWIGDLLALAAAIFWAGIALVVRATRLSDVPPVHQLMFQLVISAPIMLLIAPFFGPLVRDVQAIHLVGLVYQIFAVASFGFLFWFWLLTIYPASSVASFSFLTPVFSVFLGWLLLSEHVAWSVWGALVLVAAGIYMINRKPRRIVGI